MLVEPADDAVGEIMFGFADAMAFAHGDRSIRAECPAGLYGRTGSRC
jgi:hypothetical protein